jgi:hypothetical protein
MGGNQASISRSWHRAVAALIAILNRAAIPSVLANRYFGFWVGPGRISPDVLCYDGQAAHGMTQGRRSEKEDDLKA